jgi:uncharacterized hydrophobic protein (TIGR00271 family)
VYGRSEELAELGTALEERGAIRHATLAGGVRPDRVLLTGEVAPQSADTLLTYLQRSGVAREDVALTRTDVLGPASRRSSAEALIWADVFATASANAEVVGRYLAFMVVAGVIAGFGVIGVNDILIVGAMAVSPDTLPITSACVGFVGRRARLVRRALITLAVGLAATSVAAAALTLLLDLIGELPEEIGVGESVLASLTKVNATTIGVAFAAGIAGMLAVETRASAAVGVAISVTTIPAAAYLGVAAGVGELSEAWGALAVLAVNVAMILSGGIITLLVQRRLGARTQQGFTPSG